ncbi:MAG TPA: Flp family type IVb pilin [Terracidiphilus sp.]|nr:Flp family type IVb pilin [Terracidiphilus sp.]
MGLYAWNIYFTLRSLTLRSLTLRSLLEREEGQDLVEYALIVALIALAATAGMTSLAEAINSAFVNLSKDLPY